MRTRHAFRSLVGWWLAVGALCGISLSAEAVEWRRDTDILYNSATGTFTPGQAGAGSGNIWQTGSKAPTTGGPKWTGPTKQLPYNPSPKANFKTLFTPANMARALAKPAGAMAAGAALQALMGEACKRLAGGTMVLEQGAQWEECKFVNQTVTQWRGYCAQGVNDCWVGGVVGGTKTWFASPDAAKASFASKLPSGAWEGEPGGPYSCYNPVTRTFTRKTTAPTGWTWTESWAGCNNNITWVGQHSSGPYGLTDETQQTTQQVQDGYKSDTADNVEAKFAEVLGVWSQADFAYGFDPTTGAPTGARGVGAPTKTTGQIMDELMNGGLPVEGTLQQPWVETPLMEPPKTTTKTEPGGITTTETEQTKNDYTCVVITGGAAVKCDQTKTTTKNGTTVNSSTGQTTTSTQTISKLEPDTLEGDPCAKYPDRVGCAELDTPSGEIPRDSVSVTYTAETPFGGGSCPADKHFTSSLAGKTFKAWDWAQACSYAATYVRPVIILLATFAAFLIVMPGKVET